MTKTEDMDTTEILMSGENGVRIMRSMAHLNAPVDRSVINGEPAELWTKPFKRDTNGRVVALKDLTPEEAKELHDALVEAFEVSVSVDDQRTMNIKARGWSNPIVSGSPEDVSRKSAVDAGIKDPAVDKIVLDFVNGYGKPA